MCPAMRSSSLLGGAHQLERAAPRRCRGGARLQEPGACGAGLPLAEDERAAGASDLPLEGILLAVLTVLFASEAIYRGIQHRKQGLVPFIVASIIFGPLLPVPTEAIEFSGTKIATRQPRLRDVSIEIKPLGSRVKPEDLSVFLVLAPNKGTIGASGPAAKFDFDTIPEGFYHVLVKDSAGHHSPLENKSVAGAHLPVAQRAPRQPLLPGRPRRLAARFRTLRQARDLHFDVPGRRPPGQLGEQLVPRRLQLAVMFRPHQDLHPPRLPLLVEEFEKVRLAVHHRDHARLARQLPRGLSDVPVAVDPAPRLAALLLRRGVPNPLRSTPNGKPCSLTASVRCRCSPKLLLWVWL